MIKAALAVATLALAPMTVAAQVTLTAKMSSVGSSPHYVDTTLAAVLESAGVATVQITEGATLTNSVQAVAEGRLDMAPAPLILPFLMSRGIRPCRGLGAEQGAELAGTVRALFFHAGAHQIFGHCNSAGIDDIRKLDGLRI